MIQVLRDAITRKKPVAIATDLRLRARYAEHLTRRPTKEELAEFGTTAEVVGLREEEQSNWFYAPYLIVKLHGKQRFRLMEVYRKVNGYRYTCVIHVFYYMCRIIVRTCQKF